MGSGAAEIILDTRDLTIEAVSITVGDNEAIDSFFELSRVEGIIPALESAHAVAYAQKLARTMDEDKIIVVNLSGRGDKDMHTVAALEGLEV